MFGSQAITIRSDFSKRYRQFGLNLPTRQKESAAPNRRAKQNHDENRHENAKYENERRLDHGFVTKRENGPAKRLGWLLFIMERRSAFQLERQSKSEWVPGRSRRKLQITNIDAKAGTNARTNWHQHDILTL